jgi:hypothetical protein
MVGNPTCQHILVTVSVIKWNNKPPSHSGGDISSQTDMTCSFCRAGRIPPIALQPTEAYCANPALALPVHLQRRSTSDGVRDLYQRKEELWVRNGRSNLA